MSGKAQKKFPHPRRDIRCRKIKQTYYEKIVANICHYFLIAKHCATAFSESHAISFVFP